MLQLLSLYIYLYTLSAYFLRNAFPEMEYLGLFMYPLHWKFDTYFAQLNFTNVFLICIINNVWKHCFYTVTINLYITNLLYTLNIFMYKVMLLYIELCIYQHLKRFCNIYFSFCKLPTYIIHHMKWSYLFV